MSDHERCLRDFEGEWHLCRRIEHADGTEAQFQGRAVWTPDGAGLRYDETGTLRIGGAVPVVATRRYFWRSGLAVHFEDGRFFHRIPPSGGRAEHWCAPDKYEVTYDFAAWPAFHVRWQVSGPRKSYRMYSVHTRVSSR